MKHFPISDCGFVEESLPPGQPGGHSSRSYSRGPSQQFKLFAQTLFLLSSAFVGQACAQQGIAIRFLNFESGKPITSVNVEITLWNGKSGLASTTDRTVISKEMAKTDSEGRIMVSVPEPLPEHISFFAPDLVKPTGPRLSIGEILASGVLVPFHKEKASKLVSVQPGELVILNKHLSAADRMKREIP